jgi:hypothetical protein
MEQAANGQIEEREAGATGVTERADFFFDRHGFFFF